MASDSSSQVDVASFENVLVEELNKKFRNGNFENLKNDCVKKCEKLLEFEDLQEKLIQITTNFLTSTDFSQSLQFSNVKFQKTAVLQTLMDHLSTSAILNRQLETLVDKAIADSKVEEYLTSFFSTSIQRYLPNSSVVQDLQISNEASRSSSNLPEDSTSGSNHSGGGIYPTHYYHHQLQQSPRLDHQQSYQHSQLLNSKEQRQTVMGQSQFPHHHNQQYFYDDNYSHECTVATTASSSSSSLNTANKTTPTYNYRRMVGNYGAFRRLPRGNYSDSAHSSKFRRRDFVEDNDDNNGGGNKHNYVGVEGQKISHTNLTSLKPNLQYTGIGNGHRFPRGRAHRHFRNNYTNRFQQKWPNHHRARHNRNYYGQN